MVGIDIFSPVGYKLRSEMGRNIEESYFRLFYVVVLVDWCLGGRLFVLLLLV